MHKSSTRPLALAAAALLTALAALSGPAAEAQPQARPGRISAVSVGDVTKPASAYRIEVSWAAASSTTSYRVSASDATGAVLDKGTVASPSWSAAVKAPAGTSVRLTVTPYNGTRKGAAARTSTVLPDLTAPTGTFQLSRTGQAVTVTQTALSDDVSQPGQIARSVSWDDGTAAQPWPSGTSLSHDFPGRGLWHPTVTLTDAAGNRATVPAGVVVIGDETAPTGSFSSGPSAAWASWTSVALSQLAVHDDLSAAAAIRRTVAWGDGTESAWAGDQAAGHVYAAEGTFTPRVTLVDEAGNTAVVDADPVTVTKDAVAPTVRLRLPRHHRASVRSWRTVSGRADDAQTGVGAVLVKAIQKRSTGWYAYQAAQHRWVRTATAARAWRSAGTRTIAPGSTGTWQCSLRSLARGLLVYKARARDHVGNGSAQVVHRQLLTRR